MEIWQSQNQNKKVQHIRESFEYEIIRVIELYSLPPLRYEISVMFIEHWNWIVHKTFNNNFIFVLFSDIEKRVFHPLGLDFSRIIHINISLEQNLLTRETLFRSINVCLWYRYCLPFVNNNKYAKTICVHANDIIVQFHDISRKKKKTSNIKRQKHLGHWEYFFNIFRIRNT